MWVGFCLNTRKRLIVEISYYGYQKEYRPLYKIVLAIFTIALCVKDQHIFIWQSLEILKNFSWSFFKNNWIIAFYLKVLRLKTQHFHIKLPCQKLMLRGIEWGVQNWPFTKNGVLPLKLLFFWNFNFSVRVSYN